MRSVLPDGGAGGDRFGDVSNPWSNSVYDERIGIDQAVLPACRGELVITLENDIGSCLVENPRSHHGLV